MPLPCRSSTGPLHLLIDSTGLKVRGAGEWPARKHGGSRRRVWRKVHLTMDEATVKVPALELTGSCVGDAPVLPELLAQIPEGEAIASVTGDGAYDTRGCRDAVAHRGADALIPPGHNAKLWRKDGPGAADGNEAVRAIKHLGRAIWRHWTGYHRQSRAETKMNGMKLLGQKPMARDVDRQTAELQLRIAILNRFTALGIPVTEPVVRAARGKGTLSLQAVRATEPRWPVRDARPLATRCRYWQAIAWAAR